MLTNANMLKYLNIFPKNTCVLLKYANNKKNPNVNEKCNHVAQKCKHVAQKGKQVAEKTWSYWSKTQFPLIRKS